MEGLRIGGADALSGQGEAGIVQAQGEAVLVVGGEGDGRAGRGADGEAAVLLRPALKAFFPN